MRWVSTSRSGSSSSTMSGACCMAISASRSSPRIRSLQEFLTFFPATLELTICAMIFAIAIGIPAGVIAASRRGGIYDQTLMGVALTGYSMPIFWWGLILILVMSNTLHLTPVSGRIDLVKYYFPPVTGFMLIDQLLVRPEGRLPRCGPPPHLADHRAWHRSARHDRAHDALVDARSARAKTMCAPRAPRACRRAASSASTPCATR